MQTFFAFEDPVELQPFDFDSVSYFACVVSEFNQGGQLTVLGESGNDTDFSCADFDRNAQGDYIWWTSFTGTPAIRLITSERESFVLMEELLSRQGVVLGQNMPNPCVGNTSIRYSLAQSHQVAIKVRDTMGRVVAQQDMGTMGRRAHMGSECGQLGKWHIHVHARG